MGCCAPTANQPHPWCGAFTPAMAGDGPAITAMAGDGPASRGAAAHGACRNRIAHRLAAAPYSFVTQQNQRRAHAAPFEGPVVTGQ